MQLTPSLFARSTRHLASATSLIILLGSGCSSPTQPAQNATTSSTAASTDSSNLTSGSSPLQVVAALQGPQFVGVAVLPDGRTFVDFPRWDYNPVNPVAQLSADGSLQPYPDANWCLWNETVRNEPQKHWICPQSVYADPSGMLWVLDPAAPGLKATVVGGPKLVKIDPKTNKVVQNISFPESVAARKSY
ncbi:MAG TPA: L-dopachrome tautomerase-related protein, partial [Hymenobacter sp.]